MCARLAAPVISTSAQAPHDQLALVLSSVFLPDTDNKQGLAPSVLNPACPVTPKGVIRSPGGYSRSHVRALLVYAKPTASKAIFSDSAVYLSPPEGLLAPRIPRRKRGRGVRRGGGARKREGEVGRGRPPGER